MNYIINQLKLKTITDLVVYDFGYKSYVLDALMSLVTIAHGQLVVDCSYNQFINRLQHYANNLEVSGTKINKAIDALESDNLITFDTLSVASCNKKDTYSMASE